MNVFRTLTAIAAAGLMTLSAADLSKVIDAKRWTAAECKAATVGSSLVVNMPVDYKTGEPKYLVGWPRVYLYKLLPGETNWTNAKAISFDLKLEFTGKTAKYPISFHVFYKDAGKKRTPSVITPIPALKNNTVNKVVIPLNKIKDLAAVCGIGFNISESQYKHGENLKFTVSNFKLINK